RPQATRRILLYERQEPRLAGQTESALALQLGVRRLMDTDAVHQMGQQAPPAQSLDGRVACRLAARPVGPGRRPPEAVRKRGSADVATWPASDRMSTGRRRLGECRGRSSGQFS